jgi:hypothetical protein
MANSLRCFGWISCWVIGGVATVGFATGGIPRAQAAQAAAEAGISLRNGAPPPAEINAYLMRFRANPAKVMNEPPTRRDENGHEVAPGSHNHFSRGAIESGAALRARDNHRAKACMEVDGKTKCLGTQLGERSQIQGNDRAEDLVDSGSLIRTLEELEQKGLTSARLASQPWSDDYWGMYKGILGARYADPAFPFNVEGAGGQHWINNLHYIQSHPAASIIQSGSAEAIDLLSPSEKYEFLVGDRNGTLSANNWNTGAGYADSHGHVATWMGICHGWAPASFMLPRPRNVVSLIAADGVTPVHFYPADIKGLASLLWANGSAPQRFVGGRCNVLHPAQDANGRVIDQECYDTNPGTWHLAVVNQLGVARRGFVLDATYDYQVWNQPALGYAYSYFNPQTGQAVSAIQEAYVLRQAFTQDKFARYRSSQTVGMVGIAMDFTYVEESVPTHADLDGPAQDHLRTVRYFYDLELDSSGKVIGGEWYNNKHPDFIWTAPPGSHARSVAESQVTGNWDITRALPASWRNAAGVAMESGQPLGRIVERLIEISRPE